ncbi:hypothetical protein CY34DRAFT_750627 [Suillus luteus UH-Slu-Lm8-n1]|uniref:Uncharacterized protein n=1 Tax=Suillus luteus UH-Slu-Lm8-n1 TaxID=930992 RepID=A0A0D0B8X6_9AGAM|nr:hypothetical protein CY34DRAFT_750627 [Suillus luteus UH-Slu-Lm8-n1]
MFSIRHAVFRWKLRLRTTSPQNTLHRSPGNRINYMQSKRNVSEYFTPLKTATKHVMSGKKSKIG